MSSPPSTSSKSSTFVLEPLLPLEPLPDGTTPQLPQLPRPDPTSQPNSPSSGSSGNGKGGGSSVSIGAIVGACVGAVLLISALLYLYRRYRVRARQTKNKMRAAETSIGDPLSSTISRSNNTIAGDAYMMDAVKINMSPSNNSNNSGGGSRSIKTASGGSSGIESLSHLRPNGSADSPQFDHYGSTSFTHEKPAMVVTSMPTKSNTNDSTGEPVYANSNTAAAAGFRNSGQWSGSAAISTTNGIARTSNDSPAASSASTASAAISANAASCD
ncbi:hypothetical protein GQ42DRAFT_153932 [Ramicandelaber brevisporus]|nr:hypothetical protein GQ42DRAFT_153932 [Ramicandelaber brevisporus]